MPLKNDVALKQNNFAQIISLPLVVEFEVGGTPVSMALTIFSVCWWSTRVELTGAKKRPASPQAAEIEAERINRYGLFC